MMNLEGRYITRTMLSNMTEKTQAQMFGKVLQKRYDRSIHPHGRRKGK